jgi:hypothetical protein
MLSSKNEHGEMSTFQKETSKTAHGVPLLQKHAGVGNGCIPVSG